MKYEDIFTLISNLFGTGKSEEEEKQDFLDYDLTTDEGYNDFMLQLDKLVEDYNKYGDIWETIGIDLKEEIFDSLRDIAYTIHDKAKKSEQHENKYLSEKKYERNLIDHTEESTFRRPSELLDVERKLQLHKLVQEYVDTMIKPFNNGVLSNDKINDAYAGLYEFGAWILNK